MKKNQMFELERFAHLISLCGEGSYVHHGFSDSTRSDFQNTKTGSYVEAKMPKSQGGQIVFDFSNGILGISKQSAIEHGPHTQALVRSIAHRYDDILNVKKPFRIDVETEILMQSFLEMMTLKNISHISTIGDHNLPLIFPVRKLREHVSILARIRKKGSGSNPLNKGRYNDALRILHKIESSISFADKGYINNSPSHPDFISVIEGRRILFTKLGTSKARARMLSETNNIHLMFELKLFGQQDPEDLAEFKLLSR